MNLQTTLNRLSRFLPIGSSITAGATEETRSTWREYREMLAKRKPDRKTQILYALFGDQHRAN